MRRARELSVRQSLWTPTKFRQKVTVGRGEDTCVSVLRVSGSATGSWYFVTWRMYWSSLTDLFLFVFHHDFSASFYVSLRVVDTFWLCESSILFTILPFTSSLFTVDIFRGISYQPNTHWFLLISSEVCKNHPSETGNVFDVGHKLHCASCFYTLLSIFLVGQLRKHGIHKLCIWKITPRSQTMLLYTGRGRHLY